MRPDLPAARARVKEIWPRIYADERGSAKGPISHPLPQVVLTKPLHLVTSAPRHPFFLSPLLPFSLPPGTQSLPLPVLPPAPGSQPRALRAPYARFRLDSAPLTFLFLEA